LSGTNSDSSSGHLSGSLKEKWLEIGLVKLSATQMEIEWDLQWGI